MIEDFSTFTKILHFLNTAEILLDILWTKKSRFEAFPIVGGKLENTSK